MHSHSSLRLGCVVALAAISFGGCRVIPVEADRVARAMERGEFDAGAYVEANWSARAKPFWAEEQSSLADVLGASVADLDTAGARFGRRSGEGSPWIVPIRFEGEVAEIDRTRRAGRALIRVDGVPGPVAVQIGPVVSGFELRDSLPFIDFDDFPNQLAYADAGRALTVRAMAENEAAIAGLAVGDEVVVEGVMALPAPGEPVLITPWRVRPAGVDQS